MPEEKKEETSEEQEEEKKDEEKDTEEEEKKTEEESEKDDFEKDSETVPAGKYNQALRKLREKEAEERELKKQLEERKPVEKKSEDEEDEDFFEEDGEKKKSPDLDSLVDAKVKPILDRLNQKEENEKKQERNAFFKSHPTYLNDSEKWQELLDEMDNSLNPHSKDSYYQQLVKAHRILSGDTEKSDPEIEKKKRELASESSSKGDGAKKTDSNKVVDERAERLAKRMPIGYEFK